MITQNKNSPVQEKVKIVKEVRSQISLISLFQVDKQNKKPRQQMLSSYQKHVTQLIVFSYLHPAVSHSRKREWDTAGLVVLRGDAPMNTKQFDVTNELVLLRKRQRLKRQMRYSHSRLMRWRAELVALRQQGASFRELALRSRERRIKVSHTTVMRYLSSLPE